MKRSDATTSSLGRWNVFIYTHRLQWLFSSPITIPFPFSADSFLHPDWPSGVEPLWLRISSVCASAAVAARFPGSCGIQGRSRTQQGGRTQECFNHCTSGLPPSFVCRVCPPSVRHCVAASTSCDSEFRGSRGSYEKGSHAP